MFVGCDYILQGCCALRSGSAEFESYRPREGRLHSPTPAIHARALSNLRDELCGDQQHKARRQCKQPD